MIAGFRDITSKLNGLALRLDELERDVTELKEADEEEE